MPNPRVLELFRKLQWWSKYLGPQRDLTVSTSNGLLTFDSKDWQVGKHLYVKRSYEIDQMHAAIALLRQEGFLVDQGKSTVIDVGANIGMICIALLKHNYFRHAIAFEPAPNSYRLLVRNVRQNGFEDRIPHFPYALSSAERELELELSNDNSGDHRIRRTNARGAFREETRRTLKVEVKTLDQMFLDHLELRVEEIGLLWLDVQGHEGQLLEGARDLLSRRIPVVSELWPYAIKRSGMSDSQFCQIMSRSFTHFFVLVCGQCETVPISKIENLFRLYSSPREMCQIVLLPIRPDRGLGRGQV